MNCEKYREHYSTYSILPLAREIFESEEYREWAEHLHRCRSCADWDMARQVERLGYSVSDYPCVHIAYYVTYHCDNHANRRDCADVIINYDDRFDEYSLAPRGPNGYDITIHNCPWCGKELPASQFDLWLATLEAMGYETPLEGDIPVEFKSGAWLKNIKHG